MSHGDRNLDIRVMPRPLDFVLKRPVPSGCVLWLPGIDQSLTSPIKDRSGYGNDGTIVGATWKRLPSGLWYQYYDGNDDRTNILDSDDFNFGTGNFTIECWGNLEAGTRMLITQSNNTDADRMMFGDVAANGLFSFQVYTGNVHRMTIGGFAYTVDKWVHYAVSRLGAASWIFAANGVTEATSGANFTMGDFTDDLILGCRKSADGFWEFHKGGLILVRIHKGVGLTVAQLLGHYQQERHLFGV